MPISQLALQKLKRIWERKNPDKSISDGELLDLAVRLVNLAQAVCRPLPEIRKEKNGEHF
jgi:hypothetical protein